MFTLPENSTLVGSRAMTALLGRVPINGTVTDPYPFKLMIGKDNLTANGIELPDVEGAIVSGTASGDWTLSCVRGQVNSITFVFADGTVRTLPHPDTNMKANGNNNSGNNGRMSALPPASAGSLMTAAFRASAVNASRMPPPTCQPLPPCRPPVPRARASARGSTPRRITSMALRRP
ncbi:integrating conjugative element protein, PFL_4705 family [Serratia liquefaciens]|nr:integrating conjugative element protein, PFL_4705 family [Serratia liquefaciens]